MSGEKNLQRLLASLRPRLHPESWVFCSLSGAQYGDYPELRPICIFQEDEGLTLIVPEERAKHAGIGYSSAFGCITLTVHSSLDGVGLTAAVATRLADQGISVNVVAATYHDHLFIPTGQIEQAMMVLSEENGLPDR